MSYSRFGYADVYVFMNVGGYLSCCGCWLSDREDYYSTADMIAHLAEHRAAGHDVPDGIEDELLADDHANFVDYRRCDVDGCDERVTCGSNTSSGYVQVCSLEHGRSLGGFTYLDALWREL